MEMGRPRAPPGPGPATKDPPGKGRGGMDGTRAFGILPGLGRGGMDPPGPRFLRVPGERGAGGGKGRGGSRP